MSHLYISFLKLSLLKLNPGFMSIQPVLESVPMKKQEFIQLHRFFSVLESNMEDTIGLEPPQADSNQSKAEYERNGVKPTSIQKSKDSHQEAVKLLSNAVSERVKTAESSSEKIEARM